MSSADIKERRQRKVWPGSLASEEWWQCLLRSDRGKRLGLRPDHFQSVRLLPDGTSP